MPARTLLSLLVLLGLLAFAPGMRAQIYSRQDDSLSQKEIDVLRDTAYTPAERVAAFIHFLDARTQRLEDLLAKPRHAGRELDMHDMYAQVADVADELNDNLDEYGAQHRDLRKPLPKLLDATTRWQSVLRAAAPDERYDVARKLALTAVADVREQAEKLLPEQAAYFAAHPEEARAQAARTNHEVFDTAREPPK